MWDWLKGKKTYFAVVGLVLYGLYQAWNGDSAGALQTWLQAAAIAGLRHGIG